MKHTTEKEPDVTIIGAGIVGICCALSLLERGITVRLIDKDEPGQATSFGNAGIISPWSFIPQSLPGIWKNIPAWWLKRDGPLSIKADYLSTVAPWGLKFLSRANEKQVRKISSSMEILTSPSIDLYKKHLKGTGQENLLVDSMYVHAFRNPKNANIDAIDYKIRREKGVVVEKIDEMDLADIEPNISKDFKAAILIKNQARAVHPGKIGAVLANKARQLGAEFVRADVKDVKVTKDGEWEIISAEGKYRSPKVIIAAGIWSKSLLKKFGYSLPLISERGYHVEFPDSDIKINNSVMDVDFKIVASSMSEGVRVAGVSEFGKIDSPPDKRRIQSLLKLSRGILPDLDIMNATSWVGHRPSFPDALPVLGELPNNNGLYGAFGHSHYGLMMAPKTGQIVADMISGRPSNIDFSPFSADRF